MTPLKPRVAEKTDAEPPRWVPKPLRFACKLNPVKSEVSHLPADTEVSFAPMEAIREYGGIDLSQTRQLGSVLQGYSFFRDGDVVVAKITPCFENGKGSIASGLANGIGFGTTELHVLRPGSNVDERFLFYMTLSHEFREAGTASMYGAGGQKRVSEEFLRDFVVALPSREDQQRIADFLDRKTAEIDALIAKKERMIALLNEKRQAVITQSAINGLDATLPRRGSGVESLGPIPSHWMVCRIATVATKITNGFVGPTRGILFDDGVRYLQSLHIKNNRIRFDVPYFVNADWSNEHSKSVLRAGDVLIVQTGDIGQVAVVTPEFAGCNCHALIIVACHPKKCRGEYLSWLLNSQYGFDWLKAMQTGALHPHLNCTNIRDIPICVPPLHEQDAIIAHIIRATTKIETDTERLSRSIRALIEYRRALISEAVAGRVVSVETSESSTIEQSARLQQSVANTGADDESLFPGLIQPHRQSETPARAARAVSPAFKRAVLAAELISRMHDDPAFHKIKFQKTLFLAEHHLRLPSMETHYRRDAAGPHDNAAMRSIEKQLRDAKWYDMRRVNDQYVFDRMEKAGGHAGYFEGFWGDYSESLDALLALLRPMKTLQAEIVATLYAAWNDFLIRGVAFDDAMIVQEVLTNWNPAKERITEERWHKGLGWMREKGLVPTGFGEATTKKGGEPA